MGAWERDWKLNADNVIMSESGVSQFKLMLNAANSCFHVQFEDGEMKDLWKGCALVARGNRPLVWDPAKRLPKFQETAPIRKMYRDGINAHLPLTNANTNRIEGELKLDTGRRWVIFFLGRNAIDDNGRLSDLLIVRHGNDFHWSRHDDDSSGGPIEDGTGHGNTF